MGTQCYNYEKANKAQVEVGNCSLSFENEDDAKQHKANSQIKSDWNSQFDSFTRSTWTTMDMEFLKNIINLTQVTTMF